MTYSAPKIDVYSEEDAKQLAAELQSLIRISTYCGTQATALKRRLIIGLRGEGLDGGNAVASKFIGTSAERAAARIVEPLRGIESELYSAAQAAVLFDNRFTNLYVEPIRAARAARTRPDGGAVRVH
jgi:hypothetical protein